MPVSAVQGIREETRREQSAELKQGDVKWEVEVSLLQINLCSATAAGRFLLAAQKCQLSGSQLPASQRKALCIDMQARAFCQHSAMLLGADDRKLSAGNPICHACCSDLRTVSCCISTAAVTVHIAAANAIIGEGGHPFNAMVKELAEQEILIDA